MNTTSVNVQLNAAINLLTSMQSAIEELPARHRKKLPGASYIDDVLYRLEVAKAEVNGTPTPLASAIEDTDDLIDIIDS